MSKVSLCDKALTIFGLTNDIELPHESLYKMVMVAQICEEPQFTGEYRIGFEQDWMKAFQKVFENLRQTLMTKLSESLIIDSLEREVALLKKRISILEETKPLIIPIETFAPEPYEVLKTFHIVLQQHEEEYIATFFDANIGASGETREEAINNLKDIIITNFEILTNHDESQLGPEPLRQLRVLEKFVRKIS